jgi:O-antigen/teichoic acid export membrane protein
MQESSSAPSPNTPAPTRVLSRWSIISLILLPVAIGFVLLPIIPILQNTVDDPGLGGALTALMYAGFIMAFLCVLVGFFTGWAGARRSRSNMVLARAGIWIHGAILLLLAVAVVLGALFLAFASFISRASGG